MEQTLNYLMQFMAFKTKFPEGFFLSPVNMSRRDSFSSLMKHGVGIHVVKKNLLLGLTQE